MIKMKTKWNGWGDIDHQYKFKNLTVFENFLKKNFGEIKHRLTKPFDPQQVRLSRLNTSNIKQIISIIGEQNFSLDPLDRAVHSCGKSYYDLIRLREGQIIHPTDGVVYPGTEEEIIKILQLARRSGVTIIPFGGGTTVVGGVEPDITTPVALTIDLARMNQLIHLDKFSHLAAFQAGISGPELEDTLMKHGFTLGHFPQSFEFSTLGGWIATRSAGHKSTAYGKIEHLVLALKLALPDGSVLETPCYPAASMGPDLVQLITGSEGRFGIILEATVNIHPLPKKEIYRSYLLKSFKNGVDLIRSMLQADIYPSLLRLSDEAETATLFSIDALSSSKIKHSLFKTGLSLIAKLGYEGSLLILGFEGDRSRIRFSLNQTAKIINRFRRSLGKAPAHSWLETRYEHPYLRDELLNREIMVDTLETAATWSNLMDLYHTTREAIENCFKKQNIPGLVGVHLSHAYLGGASLYFTFMAPQIEGHEIEQWQEIKQVATNAIVKAGGALSHHHGIGRDHAPWLEASLGSNAGKFLGRIGQAISSGASINPNILYQTSSSAEPRIGSFSAENREKNLQSFQNEHFDLVVIGGGITGAGIARDAALRGMKVALLEKRDFAYGTSGRSSKLIHGGLRYLKYLHVKLVRESLREREILLKIAPHLVHPEQFLIPIYKGRHDKKFEINIGLIGYDLLAGSKRLEHHKMLSKSEILKHEPFLNQENLNGGFIYADCVVDDARLTLATIKSAAAHGAIVANYAEVTDFEIKDNTITKAQFRDNITNTTGLISGKIFINATGPWTDATRKLQGDLSLILRPTKGIHIVLAREKMPVNHVVVINTPDERMIFVVPHGNYTYIGTTDTDYEDDYDQVFADEGDVNYLIDATNQEFAGVRINRQDIISTWAGLRPLIYEEGTPSEVSRDYEIIISKNNLVTITGGKLTTYRHMAEVLIDRILKQFSERFEHKFDHCRTKELPLHGGEFKDYQSFLSSVLVGIGRQWEIDPKIIERLVINYGSHYLKILSYGLPDRSLLNRLSPNCDVLQAEVIYAIEEEMTLKLTDFMNNRSHLLKFDKSNGREVMYRIAEIMRGSLNWSDEEYQRQIDEYLELVRRIR